MWTSEIFGYGLIDLVSESSVGAEFLRIVNTSILYNRLYSIYSVVNTSILEEAVKCGCKRRGGSGKGGSRKITHRGGHPSCGGILRLG